MTAEWTAKLPVKTATDCRFDLVSLGEVMLRLDPGEGRIHTTRTFHAWEGGGEYNVARGLRRCFGLRTAHRDRAGRQPGRAARRGSDATRAASICRTCAGSEYDGVGRSVRNGLNFTERGFGAARRRRLLRPRPHGGLAAEARRRRLGRSFRRPGRARAGCTPAASSARCRRRRRRSRTRRCKRRTSTAPCVSYDLNYRDSLWRSVGGKVQAREVNRGLMPFVDVLFGNEEDFSAALGFELRGRRPALPDAADGGVPRDDRGGRRRVPEHQDGRDDAAHRALGVGERLGRDLLARGAVLRGRRSATSRSSTASAAAIRSRRASSTACWRARTRSGRSSAASRTARWRCRRRATRRWRRSPR